MRVIRFILYVALLLFSTAMADSLPLVNIKTDSAGVEFGFLNALSEMPWASTTPNAILGSDDYLMLKLGGVQQVSASQLGSKENMLIDHPMPSDNHLVLKVRDKVAHKISKLSFLANKANQAQLILSVDAKVKPSITIHDQSIDINLPGMQLDPKWVSNMDVSEFKSFVTRIVANNTSHGAKLVLECNSKSTVNTQYQAGELIFVLEAIDSSKKNSKSPLISLNFQDIPVRSLIQVIADFSGINMITSDSVKGNISIHLNNVPWNQALDTILRSQGLAMRKMDSIIYIGPANEIAAQEKASAEAESQALAAEPLKPAYFHLNYADANLIATMLQAKGRSFLSPRGSVALDARTNTLLIQDVPSKIQSVGELVTRLDVPVPQIQIQSRIVVADKKAYQELGVSGTLGNGQLNNGINPASAAAGSWSILAEHLNLNLELQALELEGDSQTISSPEVTVSDKQEAYIQQGTEVPYQENTSSGASAITFKKAVLSLKVLPQVTPDGNVSLKIAVTNDTVSKDTANSNEPLINTAAMNTQILVKDGQTLVLGGIQVEVQDNQIRQVPWLGRIPGLGWLFKKTKNETKTKQLLIFITPKIVKASKV